jgi:LysR family transcriptional regulator for metE and metH
MDVKVSERALPGRSKLEVRHLKLVQAVTRERSVTRAARHLNLSQSALSHQLLNLERDLGVALFHRIGKTMVPTSAGDRLVEYADRILTELANAEGAVCLEHQRGRIPLRLAAGCYSYYAWLATGLARFSAAHPRVDAQILLQETRREIAALNSDQIDLAITSRPPADRAFARERLFADTLVAAVHRNHDLANRRTAAPLRWNELSGEKILTYDIPDEDEARLRQAVGQGTKQASASSALAVWRVQLTESILELAAADQGVGLVSSRQLDAVLADKRLVALPLAPGHRRIYWAIWRKSNPRGLPIPDMIKTLRSTISPPEVSRAK